MVESPDLTRLEASADVPLTTRAVWAAILDGSRWPDWMASGDARDGWSGGGPRLTLDEVSPFFRPSGGRDGMQCAVGDVRQESAIISRPFGLGEQRVEWRSIVTDIDDGHSIEIASSKVGGLREWRLRVNILPTGVQPLPSWFRLAPPVDRGEGERHNERETTESTRVRAILTYRPVGMLSRFLDRVSLRSMMQSRLEAWIAGLARSLSILSDLEARAISEPIRYMPDLGRGSATNASYGSASFRPSSRTAPPPNPATRDVLAPADDLAATAPLQASPHAPARLTHSIGLSDLDTVPGRLEPKPVVASMPDQNDRSQSDVSAENAAAPPVPARAVPDMMPAQVFQSLSRDAAVSERSGVTLGTHGSVASANESATRGPRHAPARDVVVANTLPAEAPERPVPALRAGEADSSASGSLRDNTLQAIPAPTPTPLTMPAREPKPTADVSRPLPRQAEPGGSVLPRAVSPTGAAASAARPTFYGDTRPPTISASAIAASRRLAAMAANRPVTGLGAATLRPTGSNSPTGSRAVSEPASDATTLQSASPPPMPTIGAVIGGARAGALTPAEAPPAAAPNLPAPASEVFAGDALSSVPTVPTAAEASPAQPMSEDTPPSSDAAA